MIKLNHLYNEDCRDTMKRMDDGSINMVMTSPPFWALRDYGTGKNQLGLELTFDLYIKHLCDIFDEVKRVLRDDGTVWINIGDTYGGSGGDSGKKEGTQRKSAKGIDIRPVGIGGLGLPVNAKILPKSLIMIPFRFAIAMVDRGWILRNTIIWYKKNCMPSSVKDRFTVDYEYLFFFSKNRKYYFEQQFELQKAEAYDRLNRGVSDTHKNLNVPGQTIHGMHKSRSQGQAEYLWNKQGRNKRTVWTINPKPFSEAHFAVYPEELCEIPIKAGCPEFVCKKCGKPRKMITENNTTYESYWGKSGLKAKDVKNIGKYGSEGVPIQADRRREKHDIRLGPTSLPKFKGYTDCGCNAGFEGGIVYDPFMGSGTTGLVAYRLNRKFIGSEISKEYCEIAEKRLSVTRQIQFT